MMAFEQDFTTEQGVMVQKAYHHISGFAYSNESGADANGNPKPVVLRMGIEIFVSELDYMQGKPRIGTTSEQVKGVDLNTTLTALYDKLGAGRYNGARRV